MKTNETSCYKCGGNGKPSKGYMNFHNIRRNDIKEFETKLIDCTKCESCGHSWIPEKSTRELALEWWNKLPTWENPSKEYYMGLYYSDDIVTDERIEAIWLKETQNHTVDSTGKPFISSIESQNTIKPNQKQFKQANPELINAYFNKFSKQELYKVHLPILVSLLDPLDYKEFIMNQQITG